MDAGKGLSNLQSALSAGDKLDLIISFNTFPNNAAQGAAQPLPKEAVEYFAEKYDSAYTDLMYLNGECYGIAVPWGGIGMLKYNRTKMEDLGIKTPKEYYLEDNWIYETLYTCLNECVIDADGDGVNESYGIPRTSHGYYLCPTIGYDENGYLKSLWDTDLVRQYVQLYYEGFQTGAVGSAADKFLLAGVQSYPYMINFLMYEDANGDVWDSCPVPAWKDGEPGSSSLNYVYMLIPTGCEDVDQAVKMMDFIMECGLEEMDSLSGGDIYDYVGLTGCTEWTKTYIEERDAKNAELIAAILALPEYDAEWTKTINEHMANTKFHMQIVASGVDWDPWNSSKYSVLWEAPSAPSIAQIHPVIQAQCDAFNILYLNAE